jgi:predicted nucleotidyltransferase
MISAVAKLKPALAVYAREHGGRFVLFGSAARREMRDDSDVDILVDFPVAAQSDAISFVEQACWRLGLKPDILAFAVPSGHFRERVDKEGLVLPGDEESWSAPMSAEERWSEILDDARSAASHFRAAAEIFGEGGLEGSSPASYRNRMAFYHAMQSAHTGLENALKRALAAHGEVAPSGADWHRALIEQAARPAGARMRPLLAEDVAAAAQRTREFRHFAAHAYDIPFSPEKARPAVEAGRLIADRIEAELSTFKPRVGPD